MQLSLRTRNNIQEEIHGVKCLAPIETPELLSSSLGRLEAELDRIPQSQLADAFVRAWQMGERSFVSTVEFKLRFLRKCLFDVNAAVDSIIEFCHKMQSAFGDAALQRSIILHRDFTKCDIRAFKKGRYQLMPFRDRSGRRILVVFPSEEMEQMEPTLRGKIIGFLCTVAAKGDDETQRKGLVVIVWFDKSYKVPHHRVQIREGFMKNYAAGLCVRIAAIHLCSPDTPTFRFGRSIAALRSYNLLPRIKMHAGEPVELLYYSLHGYGIPTENIPMTWSGSVKTSYLKNWMKLRKAMDDAEEEVRRYRLRGVTDMPWESPMANVVECPNSNDVVFRQGTAVNCHPGNARFRSLVEATVMKMRDESAKPSGKDTAGSEIDAFGVGVSTSTTISALISVLIHQLIEVDKGKVLVWTQKHGTEKYGYGCWCVAEKKEQIRSKIEYIVREHIRESMRGLSSQPDGASTGAARGIPAAAAGGGGRASEATVTWAEMQRSNQQSTESSTSTFRNQTSSPGCSPPPSALTLAPAVARPRDGAPSKRFKKSSDPRSTISTASTTPADDSCDPGCGRPDDGC